MFGKLQYATEYLFINIVFQEETQSCDFLWDISPLFKTSWFGSIDIPHFSFTSTQFVWLVLMIVYIIFLSEDWNLFSLIRVSINVWIFFVQPQNFKHNCSPWSFELHSLRHFYRDYTHNLFIFEFTLVSTSTWLSKYRTSTAITKACILITGSNICHQKGTNSDLKWCTRIFKVPNLFSITE